MRAVKRFTEESRAYLKDAIDDAGGNEVFFLGWLDDKGRVCRLRTMARGNEDTVLAPGYSGGRDADACQPDIFIHNHPSGFLTPSDNDLVIAGKAAGEGIGAYIIDNGAEEVYVVSEPVKRKKFIPLNEEKIIAALEEGGVIAEKLPSYELRRSQLDMMRIVIKGFNEDAMVAAEAGTGVGKSFAYLLPAVNYVLDNDERVVVSTATINLQQQLFEKDIPLVAGALEQSGALERGGKKKVKAILMKGRGNYICRRRLEDALKEPDLDEDNNKELYLLVNWVQATKTGSRSDISFVPADAVWSRVCSEADLCMGMRCPERERCFVMSVRREASAARLLIVNHHLLFADLAARREGAGYEGTVVLPPYNRIILDEAHTIEEAATSFFSKEWSRIGLYKQLGRLYRRRRAARKGLLVRLAGIVSAGDRLDDAVAAIELVRSAADDVDETGLRLCETEGLFRLTPSRGELLVPLFPRFIKLRKSINSLCLMIMDMIDGMNSEDGEKAAVWEIKAVIRRLNVIGEICSSFVEYKERANEVMWMERLQPRGDPWVRYTVSPVDVAPSLKEALFDPNKTVICTSATLTVGNGFNYWAGRCGLNLVAERVFYSGSFPSPFPYSSAVLLAAPIDAPLPEEADYQSFVDGAVTPLIEASGGSALVLFTSYQALKSAYNTARQSLEASGIRCMKQGDDDRSRLLSGFLSDTSSVLFATDSFWEGVDAPGDTLRLVIIARLPFRTPNDPVFEARREALEKQGGNPFMELSLPESVMKFKQGFGRLMRRSSDHGVVAVLDGRLLRKRYGEIFLNSLPPTKKCFGEFKDIVRNTEDFLFSR